MAMIYISNTQIKNSCIELFNIPGAFFNRNFNSFEKSFLNILIKFGFLHMIW